MAPFQTPPLRVSRTVSACARCRNAKTKCDGKLPACTHCERIGKADECTSANDEYARGKERSYVASLESRIERLETEHYRLKQRQGATRAPQPHVAINITSNPPREPMMHSTHMQREKSDVDDIVSDFGCLSVNATASGFQGFVHEMSFARLVFSTATVFDLPQSPVSNLPPRELAVGLVEECLQKVLLFCPVLTSSAIFGALESAYQHMGQFCTPQQRWNLRMVLAIGSLCRSTRRDDSYYQDAVAHASAAVEYRETVIQPGSIASIQSILLLVLYSMMDPARFNTWYTIGIAARVMVDIGLHQDPIEEAHMRPAQLELRRRVFYCVYVLDRIITMSRMRTPSFTDASVEVKLPQQTMPALSYHATSFMPPNPTDVWAGIVKIRMSQSIAYRQVFLTKREELYRPWHERISLINQVRMDCQLVKQSLPVTLAPLIDMEICYFDLLLLHPHGGEQPLDPYGEVLFFQYAVEYANNTGHVFDPSWKESCPTVLDLDRTMQVGRWLLEILAEKNCPALCMLNPPPPSASPSPAPPQLHNYTLSERRTSAFLALNQLVSTIDILSQRFHPTEESSSYAPPAVPGIKQSSSRQIWNYQYFKDESRETIGRLCSAIPTGSWYW